MIHNSFFLDEEKSDFMLQELSDRICVPKIVVENNFEFHKIGQMWWTFENTCQINLDIRLCIGL